MIISPLGAIIMPALNVSPQQFGLVVSAYAFSAGLSALLAAGFADRFDRKRMLLCFYTGFVIGTLWCALADSFPALLMARVVTGLFDGVIGAVVLAIATDLSIVMVLTLTHLGPEPLPIVILVNVLMFVGIISRMVPLQALVSSIPEPTKRGSFNAVNSAVQQFAGGVASIVAGNIVIVGADGRLLNVPAIGYVVVGTTLVSLILA
jgi:predicted MFS family arabinose efflux permease